MVPRHTCHQQLGEQQPAQGPSYIPSGTFLYYILAKSDTLNLVRVYMRSGSAKSDTLERPS